MKTKIKEVQNYFKSAILEGRYEVTQTEYYHTSVLIDEDFSFKLWTANGARGFEIHSGGLESSFMIIEFNEEEKKIGYDMVMSKLSPVMKRKRELELERDKIDDQIKALSL